ncbi:ABC-type transport system auxiliary component [Candidatus Scalindua japonica]|uniref:ABC-type transport system auxiliary component n=1 Tax=Candidatus Scalindua japonica TaxID=1284222 RepID=A0A286U3Q0_9BACT|nr:ABC transporter substrate-binding protein [Candidatus Scalindua japonica]GAX62757.1 ABC-type transport system auxiliary component [Candidatus Scalindua japonica]
MKKIACLLLVILMFSQVTVAGVESEAEKLLKRSVDKVFTVLSDKELSTDQKKSKVIKVTNSVFSFSLMAKLSLGKTHWSRFNAEQRTEFLDLFTQSFQSFYVYKLDLFSDEKVIFQPATLVEKKKVWIPTVLISKGEKYLMLYRMYKTRNGWKIYDFEVEGVSMLRSYRSQYNHMINKVGIEGLLAKMREKTEDNE